MDLLEPRVRRQRQDAHAAIVDSGNLCDACASISFKPLSQTGYAFRPDADPEVIRAYEKRLFHFHHCCIACVNKASIAGCRLCALFLVRLRINVNVEYENKLGASLLLPGAGVWVVLTQSPHGVITSTDGRSFAARSDQTNWDSKFTFHYEKTAAKIDLVSLPSNLIDTYKRYPERPQNERFEDSAEGLSTSTQIAKAWYETCHDKNWGHVSCRPFGTEPQTLPTRVIDVGTVRQPKARLLPTHGAKGKYLTLSYCWGKAPQRVILLKDDLPVWEATGLPFDDLSKTIQDAIVFTRKLYFRYLWVDALCIIQNDNDDKNKEFAVMGDIYKKSALTLAAAAGSTADTGLFVRRDPLGRWPCPVYREPNPKGDDIVMFAQLPTESIVETALDSRGWVFQEDMLATRTLKFCSDGLRWSCASFWMSEPTPSLQLHPSARPHTTFREWLHQPNWKPNWHSALDMQRHFFEDWYEAVASYTDRELTHASDKLPALAGLAQSMRSLKGCTYLQGLWEEDLEYGLLWYVGTPLKASGMSDLMRGPIHYRVVPASGSRGGRPAAQAPSPVEKKKVDFKDQAGMTATQETWLSLKLFSSVDKYNTIKVPSWTWASLPSGSIRFLYCPTGLTAQGTPMATCLRVNYTKGARRNSFVAAQGGHMLLKGALEQVMIIPGKPAPPDNSYQPESMSRGKWPASLGYRTSPAAEDAVLVGYTALDQDPEKSGLLWETLTVLLMRDDTKQEPRFVGDASGGYMKSGSMLPLTLARNSAGMIVPNGERRYTTALLLKHVGPYRNGVYRRVGLCQMHHSIWQEELRFPARRQELVLIV
ncbi:HET-domain-containing protein [Ophiobolus disseminans]|uniref:HET-domain-containing protein n=1 Tax=Ophiobolus disseminans TaxID=1469910 RepID=A0A6A7A8B3_9PLEO|nr:HET-domain-containing protein [Ophiobolus disseminans]